MTRIWFTIHLSVHYSEILRGWRAEIAATSADLSLFLSWTNCITLLQERANGQGQG